MDKKTLLRELSKFKDKIKEKYAVQKVILFGSRATEKYRKDSDVDIIIVGKFEAKGNAQRAPPFYKDWNLDLPVDFICYTPEEYASLAKRITIAREAKRKGIEI